jgi:hypothetical protein
MQCALLSVTGYTLGRLHVFYTGLTYIIPITGTIPERTNFLDSEDTISDRLLHFYICFCLI